MLNSFPVTVTDDVKPGQSLHVTAPSGVTVQVVVPAGYDSGSTFHASIARPAAVATAVVEPVPVVVANTATVATPKATTLGASLGDPLNFQPRNPTSLKRSCCHICSYIMSVLMLLCGIISFVLLVVAQDMKNGKYVGYGSAAFGLFLTIFGVLAPAVVGCVGCTYRQQQHVSMVPGFRIGGWIAYGFANAICFGMWLIFGIGVADVNVYIHSPPSALSLCLLIIFDFFACVLLCVDTEISRADIGCGRGRMIYHH